MAGRLEFTIDTSGAQGFLKRIPPLVESEMRGALRDIGAFHTRRMSQGRFVPYAAGTRPSKLMSRSGNLRRGFRWRVDGARLSGLQLALYTEVPYSRIQEEGGTIRPKRARFLRVPLEPALTAAGVQSGRTALRRGPNGFVTDLGPTYVFRGRSGGLFIGIKGQEVSDGRPKAFYALVKEVTIEDRLGFVDTFRDRTRRFIDPRLGQVVRRVEARAS